MVVWHILYARNMLRNTTTTESKAPLTLFLNGSSAIQRDKEKLISASKLAQIEFTIMALFTNQIQVQFGMPSGDVRISLCPFMCLPSYLSNLLDNSRLQ